jgi:hypothetical protein
MIEVAHERIERPIVGEKRTRARGKTRHSGKLTQHEATGQSRRGSRFVARTHKAGATNHGRLSARAIRLNSATTPKRAYHKVGNAKNANCTQTARQPPTQKGPGIAGAFVTPSSSFNGDYSR